MRATASGTTSRRRRSTAGDRAGASRRSSSRRSRRGSFVDHTPYDTTSILKLIETRFGLEPLGPRDAAAADLTAALQLT